MDRNFKTIKVVLNILVVLILFLYLVTIFSANTSAQNSDNKNEIPNSMVNPLPFVLSNSDVVYITKASISKSDITKENNLEKTILNRAKAMTEVKWTPKYNLIEKECSFTFIKGKTYKGVPYSEDSYQVASVKGFLSKINRSHILYGNDCSGFVSDAWGINRQTTFTLYNEIRNGYKIGNKYVWQVSWDDLKPADALLIDNGKGEGHIMLYISSDKKNSNKLNVYEQNISTTTPYDPIPVAREDIRTKSTLMKLGYVPIRLMGN